MHRREQAQVEEFWLQLKEMYKKGNECEVKVRRNERHSERIRGDMNEEGQKRREMTERFWNHEQIGSGNAEAEDAWQSLLSTTSLRAGAPFFLTW